MSGRLGTPKTRKSNGYYSVGKGAHSSVCTLLWAPFLLCAQFIAFVRDKDSLTGGANYLISVTTEADGKLADKFRIMIEYANVACA